MRIHQAERTVNNADADLVKAEKFKYLGSVLNQNGECEVDVKGRTQSGVLADKRMPKKLKSRI